jgi:hypothetical protein
MIVRIIVFIMGLTMMCSMESEFADIYGNYFKPGVVTKSTAHVIERTRCERYLYLFTQCRITVREIADTKKERLIKIRQTFSGSVHGETVYPVLAGPAPQRVTTNLGFDFMTNRNWTMFLWSLLGLVLMIGPLFGFFNDELEPSDPSDILWNHFGSPMLDDKLKH